MSTTHPGKLGWWNGLSQECHKGEGGGGGGEVPRMVPRMEETQEVIR